ncbi:MAG: uroporphyrinogen decarboxylase family protein [Armatimonadota bacterium]
MSAITSQLPGIVRLQDAKIRDCLDGRGPVEFWYAHCPLEGKAAEQYARLHQLGFDNYPVAQIPALDALQPYLFFFERVLGAELQGVDGQCGDFFHTWCRPLLPDAEAIFRLTFDLDRSPLWGRCEQALRDYLRETPAEARLPVLFPGVSPLDMACNLCGTEAFFLLLYEHPFAVEYLLDTIPELLVTAYRRFIDLGARPVTAYGFPGIYISDLQMPYLSPAHLSRFVLPRYARLADACGGLCLALLTDDLGILTDALAIEGLIGCAFDKRLPLPAIEERLGAKVFLLPNYIYDDQLDAPACRDGVWCNPIVQSYSREPSQVYREFTGRYSLAISLQRPSLAEVRAARRQLQMGIP